MDDLVFVGAALALVWGAVIFLRGGVLAGSLVVLLAAACFSQPFFALPMSPAPLTIDRALLGLLLVQVTVYRRWGWVTAKRMSTADWLLAAFITVLLVSTFTHDFHARNSVPVSQIAFFHMMPLMLYVAVRHCETDERRLSWLFFALPLFGLYLAITAIAETHGAWALVFPKYVASPAFPAFFGRGRGPLLNPVGCGLLQGLCLCAGLCWWPNLGRWGRILLVGALLPVGLWGIYSTLTRSVWMGGALGLLVLFGLTVPRNWRAASLTVALLAGFVGTMANWESLLTYKRDKELSAELTAESARLRPYLAMVAWQMFLDRPLLGCGYGQYTMEYGPYLVDRSIDMPLEKVRPFIQHNVFLALLTETGLVGMGLFIALLAFWARDAWRLWRSPQASPWARRCGLLFLALLGNYLPNAMFHELSLVATVNMFLFFMAGLAGRLAPEACVAPAVRQRSEARLADYTHLPQPGTA